MNRTTALIALAGLAAAMSGGVFVSQAQAQSCPPEFADNFEVAGVVGDIFTSVIYDAQDGNGPRLYVGGQFSRAGGKLCNGVAMWNGTAFEPLGGGVPQNNLATSGSGTVKAMAVLDPDGDGPLKPELWVGGAFTRAQQPSGTRITVNGIARWNGSTRLWSAVPRGAGETDVLAFLPDEQSAGPDPIGNPYPNAGPRMYVATNSPQSPTPYLMAYVPSGTTFSRIDFFPSDFQPLQNFITSLVKYDGRVYFGGAFDQGVRRITEDGTGHEPLPAQPAMAFSNFPVSQANAVVGSMIVYQNRLLIAPQNTAPAGSAINMVPPESFDGTAWQPEAFGPLGSTVFSAVGTMKLIDLGTGPKLYFGGSRNNAFNTADFQTPAGLPPEFNGGAVWDGTALSPLGSGIVARFLSPGNAMTFSPAIVQGQPAVFTGGILEFGQTADGALVQGRGGIFWNETEWIPQHAAAVNNGFTGNTIVKLDGVNPVIVNNGSLDQALLDADNRDGISQYDGTGWSGSTIRSARSTNTVSEAHYIRYDDGTGEALFAFGNTFDAATPITRVAKYDASNQTWNSVSDGAAFPGSIATGTPEGNNFTGIVFDTDGAGPERPWLIIAGNANAFDPGFPANNTPNIYAYTGSEWVVLGSGLPDTGPETANDSRVTALAIHDDGNGPKLYAAGTFTGADRGSVARYDGTGSTGTWTIIGRTTAAFENFTKVRTLDLGSGSAVFAFGLFTDIYNESSNPSPTGPVARWTGTEWVGLNAGTLARNGTGGPIAPFVADIASFNDGSGVALYATGPFGSIGGISGFEARGLARYDGVSWSPVGLGLNSFNDNLRMQPRSLVVFDDDGSGPVPPALYISGFFDNADGKHSENFARYGAPSTEDPACNPCSYDFNQDENVDLLDAQQMAQVFVGLITPEAGWLDGDLNGDENADLTDAQLLAAFVVTGVCGA